MLVASSSVPTTNMEEVWEQHNEETTEKQLPQYDNSTSSRSICLQSHSSTTTTGQQQHQSQNQNQNNRSATSDSESGRLGSDVRSRINKDIVNNIDSNIEKNRFIKNNYDNNIEETELEQQNDIREIECNNHTSNNSE